MTKNDHIYSSAALKKNINARSLTMRVRIFQPQCYVPVAVLHVGYAEVIFIQPGGKLDTMWHDAWQRLASSYPTSRWKVAVNLMVTAAGRCSLSHRQKHRNLQLVNCSSLSQTFCPPNSPDLDTVKCHLGCNSADSLPSYRFLLSWQN